MFLSELSPLSFPSSDNTLLGWINIDTRCYVANNCWLTNKINRSLNILVLLKTKFNASKKRIKQTWDEVYANNSSIDFVHLILIPLGIKHYRHASVPYAQLWLLNDVNTPSAHGLQNSKAYNKYQVNSVAWVYPSRQDK